MSDPPPADDPHRENRRLWNEWSDAFQALWNADTDEGGLPPVPTPFERDPDATEAEYPPTAEGSAAVELGCGGGQGSVGTALAGADRVVGVDLSGEQLRHARRLRDYYGADARFVQADVTRVPLAADAFDLAFSEWAFQLVADLDAALAEARRLLRPGGVLLLSVPHPFREAVGDESGRVERPYRDRSRRTIEIDEAYGAEMVVFDRSIGELHRALVDAGFAVERILEPEPDDGESSAGDSDDEFDADSDNGDAAAALPRDLRFWARVPDGPEGTGRFP